MKFNKIKLAMFFTGLITVSNVHANSINDQMRDAFGLLMNTTKPNSYNTARRGVISGGSLFIKSPAKRTNFLSATAPSISAGCGGIDIYGGSFSFINKDQFIETFQAIGANALGYGVKLAVQSACPTCEQVMTSLEKTAQFINSMNVDSCQAAQGIVNAGVDFATSSQSDTVAKNYGVNTGQWEDLNEAWGWVRESGKSPTNEIASNNPDVAKDKITINVVWRSMKESGMETVFGSDDQFLELVMTMIGTVLIKNPSSEPETDPKPVIYAGNSVKLTDLINGGTFKIYDCDTTDEKGCLNIPASPSKAITIKGLRDHVYEALLGAEGVVQAYKNDTEWSSTAKQALKFSSILGGKCLEAIYRSSINGTADTTGSAIASVCADQMALEVAYAQVNSYIQTALSTIQKLPASEAQEGAKKQAIELLTSSQKAYNEEFIRLGGVNGSANILSILNSVSNGESTGNTVTGD